MNMNALWADTLLNWYDANRRDLPWRRSRDPYHIWLSEIMLQQTRVETVRDYYRRFLERFPTVSALALAPEQDVLKAWEGLGYYSRARNLHKGAQAVLAQWGGRIPRTAAQLKTLPGVGAYTSGAIASIAFGERVPAVDGNVERVTARIHGIREDVGIPSVHRALVAAAVDQMPETRPGDFNQAMMELGACVCLPGTPRCDDCPLWVYCDARDAGDAQDLPIHQKPGAKRMERRAIALVFQNGSVLVRRRAQRLLKGLWEFPSFLLEDVQTEDALAYPDQAQAALLAQGISVRFTGAVGAAKHVFTHLIWEMTLLCFEADLNNVTLNISPNPSHLAPGLTPDDSDQVWADAKTLAALPFPTALKKARAMAMERLS
jgi:A/G-specific adenine glycosylase